MSLAKDQAFLLKEVFTKITYDKTREIFIIRLDAYLPLKISADQYRLLEKMCKDNNIELEKLPPRIYYSKGENLLIEYHKLKNKIKNEKNQEEKEKLEKKLIEIRNEIAEGYMSLVYKIINRTFKNLEEEQDREDIYQVGYMVLLDFIDNYKPDTNLTFDHYIRSYIAYRISDILLKTSKISSVALGRQMKKLTKAKDKNPEKNLNPEELAIISGLSEDKIRFLESPEIIEDISLEEYISEGVIDETNIELEIIDQIIKEHLVKFLDFLSEEEREIIMLYYGFFGGIEYTLEEIGTFKGNLSRQRISNIIKTAINKLREPIFSIYLSEKIEDPEELEYFVNNTKIIKNKNLINNFEIFLLTHLNQGELEEYISNLSDDIKPALSLYLGLNGTKYKIERISKILKLQRTTVKKLIEEGLEGIKNQIEKQAGKEFTKGEYFKYLTNLYLTRPEKRRNH